jgi:magnesium transporter
MVRKATSRFFKLGEANKEDTGEADLSFVSGLPISLQCVGYSDESFEELTVDSLPVLVKRMHKYPVMWINIKGAADIPSIQPLTELFSLHELAIEDALKFHQRSKVDAYNDHLFIVLRVPTGKEDSCDTEQLALFLGKNYVLSFQEKDGGACLESVRERIRKGAGNIRKLGADYLAYAIVDAGIDAYFPLLERLGERIETLEERIIAESAEKVPAKIHDLKLEVLAVRRSVWPMRDTINTLCRDISPYVTDTTRLYMRDCYDHLSRIIDLVEMYRELSTDLMNIYLSTVNNRMNEIIKVLTVITTMFIPPTFIAGLYGMNFKPEKSPYNMPELEWYYGYPFAILLMVITSGAVLFFLRRRRWL